MRNWRHGDDGAKGLIVAEASLPSPVFAAMVLPFPLGLKACPEGRLLAEAAVALSPEGRLETHCSVSADGAPPRTLWRSARVAPTADGTQMAWRANGERLAVSQFRTAIVADLEGGVWRHLFAEPVAALAYGGDGALLVLAGRTLYRCGEPVAGGAGGDVQAVRTEVLAFAVDGGVAFVAAAEGEAVVVAALDGAEAGRFPGGGRKIATASLAFAPNGEMFLGLRDGPADGRCRTTILRVRDGRVLLDAAIGVGIAEPGVTWQALDGRRAAVAGELDEVAGLWEVDEDGGRRRLSPGSLEVELAVWSPGRDEVLVSGRDLAAPGQRRSQRLDDGGRLLWEAPASILLAEWTGDEHLACAAESGGGWSVSRIGPAAGPPLALLRPAPSCPLPGGAPGARMVAMGALEQPRLGIIYAMGPHRFFAGGGERLFYHHAIRAQAEALGGEGALLLGLNGAGALGAGGRHRLAEAPPYDAAAVADIAAAAAHLRSLGAPRIVLVAASLGCLPAIRFLAREDIDGAILLNPVYSSDIAPLAPWRRLYGPESLLGAALARHAPSIRTPLLIVHGQRDPISPSQHSSDFFMALPEDLACDYVSVPDEGHIFQTDAGWRILLEKTRSFLEAALPGQEERVG